MHGNGQILEECIGRNWHSSIDVANQQLSDWSDSSAVNIAQLAHAADEFILYRVRPALKFFEQFCYNLVRSAKLPTGLYILLALISFFIIFFF